MRELRVIDADGHITEPPDLWERYIDPEFRNDCPKITILPDGRESFRIDDKLCLSDSTKTKKLSIAMSALFGARDGRIERDRHYFDGEAGGFDPQARIQWLDNEGVDGTVLFPTMALLPMQVIDDRRRLAAVVRAYNRYLVDFCSSHRDRLFGAAILPLVDIEDCINEIEWAKEHGLNVGVVRPNPRCGHVLHDPWFDPIWRACQDMDFPIAIHGSAGLDNMGVDRFRCGDANIGAATTVGPNTSYAVEHCYVHTAEMMAAITSFVLAGVCEKFPRLRIAFVEGGATWVPGYIDRMDRHFDDIGMNDLPIKTRPGEIFARQCWLSFEPIEQSMKALAEYFGPNKLMFSSDYPHSDGFPSPLKLVRELKLPANVERALLSQGFKEWYGPGLGVA